ncbi:MAG TPA: S-layer homology domain-containing protein [Candidatus Avimonoglobus intestinipullorum]|uniref:S-layer homology domain-containing protein n=1 Tax=Candidatus Avimonoglobus intestinipullorum TaxID=2840699 RepID=A0A9D1LTV1_9FIRM|nr:S-layer homology domain-containing protein [Candidatus Avimonoglobus intestinipullorum]
MKIKRLAAGALALVMSFSGLCAFAEEFPENTWSFETETGLPEHFSYNNMELPLDYSHTGSDGTGRSLGFAAGIGFGRGDGTISESSNGMNIYSGEISPQTDGSVSVCYDFLIENDNLCAYLIAPRFGGAIAAAVTLREGAISFEGEEIATVAENEWHSIGVQYTLDSGNLSADVYFDGVMMRSGAVAGDIPQTGITGFSILVNPNTSDEEFRENTRFDGRNEIMRMDNLYIGPDDACFQGAFKAVSVAQGDDYDQLEIIFNRAIDAASINSNTVSVSGMKVAGCTAEGSKLYVTLDAPMTTGTTYTVRISDQIASMDGIAFSGTTEFQVTASFPKTVNMLWDFNDKKNLPDYFVYNNKEVPIGTGDAGASGEVGDNAYTFLIGVGQGMCDENYNIDRYTNGFRILHGALDSLINNVQLVYDIDFYVKNNDLIAWLFAPSYGTSDNSYYKPVELTEGVVSFQGQEIGRIEANEWHNLGVVCTLSSASGLVLDIYFDGVKKISGYTDDSATARSGIKYFSILAGAHTTQEEYAANPRFDSRNEYFVMDNLYIGNDPSQVMKNLVAVSSSPADGSQDADVNSQVRVQFNDALANTDTQGLMWLTDGDGNRVDFESITIADGGYGLAGTLAGPLNYRELYNINFSEELVSQWGKTIQAGDTLSFTTGGAYSAALAVNSLTRQDGKATAEVSVSGHDAGLVLIAGSYDASGAMTGVASQELGAAENTAVLEFDCPDGATVKVFAVDSLQSGRLIAEPYMEETEQAGYYQNNTAIELNEADCRDKIITVSGTTNTKNGYLLGKLAADGAENSENAAEYLSIDAIRCDENGAFSFAGRTDQASGSYSYIVTAPDNGTAVQGETEYTIETGNTIQSMALNGANCTISGQNISLTTSGNLSGMLVTFTISDKASLYLGDELLVSGQSRINCTRDVALRVVSEMGEENNYTLRVTAISSGGGGSSGGNSSSGTGSNNSGNGLIAYIPADEDEIAAPLEETRFEDVGAEHWAHAAIEALAEQGIVSGVSETSFEPERQVTREEFAVLLQKAFGYEIQGTRISFDDVAEDAWYADAVYALAENGIASGTGPHLFGVGGTITRQDMAAMLWRCAETAAVERVRDYTGFTDEDSIAEYAAEAVEEMYCRGLLNGMEDGSFRPQEGTTRAQAAYLINSILGT